MINRRETEESYTYMIFVDLEKEFGNVEWNKTFNIKKKIGINFRERKIILNLWWDRDKKIKKNEEALIKKGVRKDSSLLFFLLNIHIEREIKEINEECNRGVITEGETLRMIRFVDKIILSVKKAKNMESMLNKLDDVLNIRYAMKINKRKTKVKK